MITTLQHSTHENTAPSCSVKWNHQCYICSFGEANWPWFESSSCRSVQRHFHTQRTFQNSLSYMACGIKLVFFPTCLLQCLHCTDEAHKGPNRGSPVCSCCHLHACNCFHLQNDMLQREWPPLDQHGEETRFSQKSSTYQEHLQLNCLVFRHVQLLSRSLLAV